MPYAALNPQPLIAAALAYADAATALHKAHEAHDKNRGLDEFDSKHVKTENRVYHAEQTREARKRDLVLAALIYAGVDEYDIGEVAYAAVKAANRRNA